MAPQAGETLADLINAVAGRGMTFDDLAKRSIDPDSQYQPSGSMVWRVARGEGVKINPGLVRAIGAGLRAAGFQVPQDRVEAAAHRQFIGPYAAIDPGLGAGGNDDEVIRVARPADSTTGDTTGVEEFVRRSRTDDAPDQQ